MNGSAKTRAGELLAARQIGESRWPPALALLAFMALNIALRVWLPNDSPVRVAWLVPAIEAVLLVVLVVGPANVPMSRRWVRRVSMTLVIVLVAAALWATTLLIYDLIKGEGVTETPSELLASGAVRVAPLVTRVASLDDYQSAFADARRGLKVMFRI